MKRLFYILIVAAGFTAAITSCDKSDKKTEEIIIPPYTEEEGKFVSVIESDVNGKWVTILYTAMGADGSVKNLSELICLPAGTPSNLIIGCHITIVSDSERPTNYKNLPIMTDVGFLSSILTLKGALVVFPDYEGYGSTSADPHPYLNRELTARQVIAGAKAALEWLEKEKNVNMPPQWRGYTVGYSQGGAVAASVLRYYREYQLDGLNLTAAICGDGPYDPMVTLTEYIEQDKLYMPVAAVLVLKGLVDTDKNLKSLGCTYADFVTQGLIDTKIFELLEEKQLTNEEIHNMTLAHSKDNGGFTMMVYNYKAEDFLPYNAENTAAYQDSDWDLSVGNAKSYCTASQCFKPEVISFFKDGTTNGRVPAVKLEALKKALEKNSLTYGGWMPDAHTKDFLFFHSTRDEIVPFANYQSVISAWGEDCIDGRPSEDLNLWTHYDAGTMFVLLSSSFYDEFEKREE